GTDTIEGLDRSAIGVGVCLEHQRGNRPDKGSPGNARGAMPTNVARYFAAASGMADQRDVFQIERLDEGSQVICIGVQVVPIPRLAGAPMSATIMGNGTIVMRGHKEQLVIPGVGIKRPTMAKDHYWPCAPIFVKDLGAIFCGNSACAHIMNCSFRSINVLSH